VYLASLYIGPAADDASVCEQELLDSLSTSKARDIRILLDKNRALRKVPLVRTSAIQPNAETITSAESCHQALLNIRNETSIRSDETGIYLLSVLPSFLQQTLKNPFNEIAGVFHLKCYIIDNELILTGANLSEEYFTDRTDRYLWIVNDQDSLLANSENNLVDCYASVIRTLCQYAQRYKSSAHRQQISRQALIDSLAEFFLENRPNPHGISDVDADDVVAYAVPTFQVPAAFSWGIDNPIPSDVAIMTDLIHAITSLPEPGSQMRLVSAYMNLTNEMIESMTRCCKNATVHLLTAGRTSHGFKPNPKKVGNKGTTWIPAVFDSLVRQTTHRLRLSTRETRTWYYEREGWTFHAKGIWFTINDQSTSLAINDPASLCLVTHGSGNYGGRSTYCDMESNLILVLSDSATSLQTSFTEEWNAMSQFAVPLELQQPFQLPLMQRVAMPLIRYFV
jgi:CDP-diacylglycerol--glycerol-3-phosphate 3-phosphatidyltransferase